MRVTSFPLATLRDTPSEAEVISHQLLLKGGYIRRVNAGIYAYMPLMLRVIEKISSIVDQELKKINCHKLLLPQLHPADLWRKSGRWEGYTAGEGIMFSLIDRQNREFGLAPTHEEVITTIASELINSYKQLPLCFYQTQTKFRDEIRPRFGLMRSREFIMKDAYSFHDSEEDLRNFYKIMAEAYENIFKKCGLSTVGVEADSGAIGGVDSKEYMVTADSGEDSILFTKSGSYAANIEKAISLPNEGKPLEEFNDIWIKTPNQKTIAEICKNNNFDPSQLVKVVIFKALFSNNKQIPVIACIRGDQNINETKIFNLINKNFGFNLISLSIIDNQSKNKQNLEELPWGFIGPDIEDKNIKEKGDFEAKWLRIADHSANKLDRFISGGNKADYHKVFNSLSSLDCQFLIDDIRNAKIGDKISSNSNETLIEKKGIEIGHIFQLGQKYSKKMNARFSDKNGNLKDLWMGCYGIGITRLAQAAVEQNNDESGICWPIALAPFEIILIPTNFKDSVQAELSENIYLKLKEKKIDVIIDDRDERAGVKFKDADLIGIPFRIVIGRGAVNDQVELVYRSSKENFKLSSDGAIKKFLTEYKVMYN